MTIFITNICFEEDNKLFISLVQGGLLSQSYGTFIERAPVQTMKITLRLHFAAPLAHPVVASTKLNNLKIGSCNFICVVFSTQYEIGSSKRVVMYLSSPMCQFSADVERPLAGYLEKKNHIRSKHVEDVHFIFLYKLKI